MERLTRREILKRGTQLTGALALTLIFPTTARAEDENEGVSDLTYSQFIKLLPNPENPQNVLRDFSKTIRITLDRDVRILRSDETLNIQGNFDEKISKGLFMEEQTRGNLIYIYVPEKIGIKSEVYIKDKALRFEQIPVSDEIALNLAKRATLPLVFRGETTPPAQRPSPTPKIEQNPLPSPCPLTPIGYEIPCEVPLPANYASH